MSTITAHQDIDLTSRNGCPTTYVAGGSITVFLLFSRKYCSCQ